MKRFFADDAPPYQQLLATVIAWTIYSFLFGIIFNWLTDWFEGKTLSAHFFHALWMGIWMTCWFKWKLVKQLFRGSKPAQRQTDTNNLH